MSATVSVTREFAHSAEQLFDAWLAPELAQRFLFATSTGRIVRCEIDPHPGGRFLIADLRDGEEVEHHGEYLVLDRPRRLVFSFTVPKYSGVWTEVEVVFAPTPAGCAIALTHTGVLPEWAASTEAGWRGILEALEGVLAAV